MVEAAGVEPSSRPDHQQVSHKPTRSRPSESLKTPGAGTNQVQLNRSLTPGSITL